MKYHEKNTLCLTYAEYVACFTVEGYKTDKKRGKLIVVSRGGGKDNEALIDYESLPTDRKKTIIDKYGDPYKYILKQPLADWAEINWNKKAYEFYNNYVLQNGNKLPEEYRDKYTKAVTYIDGINHYTSDKLALKRDFNINMQSFWAIVADVLKAENVDLPKNEKRLKERIAKYKQVGYTLLIEEFRFSNDNSKKVKDQLAEDILMKLIELDQKHADEVVAAAYNCWAAVNNRKTITPAAVAYRRRTQYHEVIMAREGKAKTYSMYNKQIKQHRATAPLMLINSDDNVLDLYFKEVSRPYHKSNDAVSLFYS